MKMRRTVFANNKMVKRDWYLVDAANCVLGRLATKVATYLRGKHKPLYTPQTDCGDYIVVANAEKIKVTGKKFKDKQYFTHSGYPGGDMLRSFEVMMARKPERVIQLAVKGMLPHNRLGAIMFKKLKVFRGEPPKQFSKFQRLEV